MAKLSERLQPATKIWVQDNPQYAADLINRQRDLLDKAEAAFLFIAQGNCLCDECSKAREMIAAIRREGNE